MEDLVIRMDQHLIEPWPNISGVTHFVKAPSHKHVGQTFFVVWPHFEMLAKLVELALFVQVRKRLVKADTIQADHGLRFQGEFQQRNLVPATFEPHFQRFRGNLFFPKDFCEEIILLYATS